MGEFDHRRNGMEQKTLLRGGIRSLDFSPSGLARWARTKVPSSVEGH